MHLSPSQLQTLKDKLEDQQQKLRDVLSSLERTDPANDEDRSSDNADVGTEATESEELVRHESLERETEIMLKRTEEALANITTGTYGHTSDGREIPYERLLIDPSVTTLVE